MKCIIYNTYWEDIISGRDGNFVDHGHCRRHGGRVRRVQGGHSGHCGHGGGDSIF